MESLQQPGRLGRREKLALFYLAAGLLACLCIVLGLAEFHEEIIEPASLQIDLAIQARVHAYASPVLTQVMKALTTVGAPVVVIPLCSAIAVAIWWRKRRQAAALLLSSMLGSALLVIALKIFYKRKRPDVSWSLVTEHSYSFPSGHSMMAVVLYGTLLYLFVRELRAVWARVLAIAIALLLALGIGVSRIYLGAHFPSDVAAGYLCGAGWLVVIVAADLLARGELEAWLRRIPLAGESLARAASWLYPHP